MNEDLARIAARFFTPNPRPLPREGVGEGVLLSFASFFSSLASPSSIVAVCVVVLLPSAEAPFAFVSPLPAASSPPTGFGCGDGLVLRAAKSFEPLRPALGGGDGVFVGGDALLAGSDVCKALLIPGKPGFVNKSTLGIVTVGCCRG